MDGRWPEQERRSGIPRRLLARACSSSSDGSTQRSINAQPPIAPIHVPDGIGQPTPVSPLGGESLSGPLPPLFGFAPGLNGHAQPHGLGPRRPTGVALIGCQAGGGSIKVHGSERFDEKMDERRRIWNLEAKAKEFSII